MTGAGYQVRNESHPDIAQGKRPVHSGGKPDDPHDDAEDCDAPPLLHFSHHQQINRAAQQRRPHRHIEGQDWIRGERKSADQGKHKKDGTENTRCHKILDRKALLQ